MDYKIIGVYNENKDSSFNGSFLYNFNGKKYEIQEFPIDNSYVLTKNTVIVGDISFPLRLKYKKIIVTNSNLFICYSQILEIYDLNGNLIREIISKEPIIIGNNGFIVYDKSYFIVNLESNTVFIKKIPNIVDFTGDGKIFTYENITNNNSIDQKLFDKELIDNTTSIDNNNSIDKDIVNNNNSIDNDIAKNTNSINSNSISNNNNLSDKHLMEIRLHSNKIFNFDGEIITKFREYTIFKKTAKITNFIACSTFKLLKINDNSFSDCTIVLCTDFLFVIFDDIIIRKELSKKFSHIIHQKFIIHNYLERESFYDCILLINCIKSTELHKSDQIEQFIISLFALNIEKDFIREFIKSFMANFSDSLNIENRIYYKTILCRIYRQVDDPSKQFLDEFIDFRSLNADQMFLIIIYKPDLTDQFIALCKFEERLFYLEDLRDFYIKTERIDECKGLFLKNGMLLFEYKGLEKLYEIEKQQIKAQRLSFVNKSC